MPLASTSRNSDSINSPNQPPGLLGRSLYILSQVMGSTMALQYMQSEYMITTLDAVRTPVLISGVVGVIGFGNIQQAEINEEANMFLIWLQQKLRAGLKDVSNAKKVVYNSADDGSLVLFKNEQQEESRAETEAGCVPRLRVDCWWLPLCLSSQAGCCGPCCSSPRK
ncbi:hypothetical protein PTTG_25915 [Puccinia triticina 1-1 BBBD Race 1]|uniref:Uncharacterized protein n=1 Tax=Puccinia triticina (isolate 1-1 / race 1 (BBBD)) TaxID=630390 RepID=A0A180GYS5_PUCT1|nr:hypothetical protein PTTG_25915 [Puccinia triticina 1-1 BBBD Race 1]